VPLLLSSQTLVQGGGILPCPACFLPCRFKLRGKLFHHGLQTRQSKVRVAACHPAQWTKTHQMKHLHLVPGTITVPNWVDDLHIPTEYVLVHSKMLQALERELAPPGQVAMNKAVK
jgi:hypothetical protein